MIQTYLKKMIILFSCILLAACGDGQRRVDGELAFDSESLMNMAESFLKAGDYGNAMRLYQRAANENPAHVASRLGLARTYQAMGATDAALNFYDQALSLDPNNAEAKLGTGQMLITKNRPADAIPYLNALQKADPGNYKIYNMLGLAHDLMGDQETAQMNYGRGLEISPDNISLLNNLALSFAFEGQYAPSIKLLSKAINLDYSVTKAQQNLVLAYVLSGEEAAGRKIGESLMTEEEMENNIRHYKWVESLPPAQRAQAIFLGVRSFPKEKGTALKDTAGNGAVDAATDMETDPKKRQLLEVLKQEGKSLRQEAPTGEGEEQKAAVRQQAAVEAPTSPPTAAAAPASQQIYRVQLGSYPNTKIAAKGWKKIKRRSKGRLDAYEPLIRLVTLANNQTLFRLFVGGIEDRAIAQTVCNDLRELNIDCLVLKTTPQ